MAIAYLFLGSNVGRRELNLARALEKVRKWPKTKVLSHSIPIETQPEGNLQQRFFLNQAVKIMTALKPLPLLLWSKKTELELGRKKSFHKGPREIDIDILLYGQAKIKSFLIEIPHPRLHSSPSMQSCLRALEVRSKK